MAKKNQIKEQFSLDAVYDGRLVVHQPKKGYRFSIDALLLTFFACEGRRVTKAVDLGAGSGVVGLSLLAAGGAENVLGVELQPSLAEIARVNAEANGLESRYEVKESDIRDITAQEHRNAFGLVTANPPFWPAFDGRLPREEERQVACHEVHCGLEEWTRAAARLMNPRKGRFAVVFPARRVDTLIIALETARLSTKRMRFVQPYADKPAELVLVEARTGETGRLEAEPPLILKNPDGTDSEATKTIVNGEFSNDLKALPSIIQKD